MTPDVPDKPLSAKAQRRLALARHYGLQDDEEIGEGIRRIARGRTETALEQLHAQDQLADAIHDTRKDMKKLRSLLRLVRDGIGEDVYRTENDRYRDAAQLLSGPRDAEVKLETLAALRKRYPDDTPAAEGLQRALEEERERLAAEGDELRSRMEDAATAIAAGQGEIDKSAFASEGFELVRPGIERAYRRGRRAFEAVRDAPTDEAVHEWRKRVKDLWYQTRLVRAAWDRPLTAAGDEAHDLADLLGDHHDLAVLVVDAHERGDGDADALATVARRRQAELIARALGLGSRLYAEKPGRFVDRLDAYWHAWRPSHGAAV